MNITRYHHLSELILISLILTWMFCDATDGQARAKLTGFSYDDDQAAFRKYVPQCCPSGWTLFQEPDNSTILNCAKIIFDWNATYSEIKKRCNKEGGWPASIHSSFQNYLIKRKAQAQRVTADIGGNPELVPNYVSIGLTNQRPHALQSQDEAKALYSPHHHIQDWFWLNQTTVDYTHWEKGYPKVSVKPRCAVMVTKHEDSPSYGFWRDFDCDELRAPFVCQVQSCNCEEEKGYVC
uniref:C-type lectin domain-containing protein n=1 Tax=Plectus sambesii TaxID=2011161 RepID=A0A914WCB2_9BILA